jgi:hypothetical protein
VVFWLFFLIGVSSIACCESRNKQILELEARAEKGDLVAVFRLNEIYRQKKDRSRRLYWLKRGTEMGGATQLQNYSFALRQTDLKQSEFYREAASGAGNLTSFEEITDSLPEKNFEQRKIKFLRRLVELQHPDGDSHCGFLLEAALLAADRESLMLALLMSYKNHSEPVESRIAELQNKVTAMLSEADIRSIKNQIVIDKQFAD